MFGYGKRSADVHVTLLVVPLRTSRTSLAHAKGPTSRSQTGADLFEGLLVATILRTLGFDFVRLSLLHTLSFLYARRDRYLHRFNSEVLHHGLSSTQLFSLLTTSLFHP
jgi:hypothetical protein